MTSSAPSNALATATTSLITAFSTISNYSSVTKLSVGTFFIWRLQLTTLLGVLKLQNFINTKIPIPTDPALLNNQMSRECQALNAIHSTIDDENMLVITTCVTAYEADQALYQHHCDSGGITTTRMFYEIVNLRLTAGGSVAEHVIKFDPFTIDYLRASNPCLESTSLIAPSPSYSSCPPHHPITHLFQQPSSHHSKRSLFLKSTCYFKLRNLWQQVMWPWLFLLDQNPKDQTRAMIQRRNLVQSGPALLAIEGTQMTTVGFKFSRSWKNNRRKSKHLLRLYQRRNQQSLLKSPRQIQQDTGMRLYGLTQIAWLPYNWYCCNICNIWGKITSDWLDGINLHYWHHIQDWIHHGYTLGEIQDGQTDIEQCHVLTRYLCQPHHNWFDPWHGIHNWMYGETRDNHWSKRFSFAILWTQPKWWTPMANHGAYFIIKQGFCYGSLSDQTWTCYSMASNTGPPSSNRCHPLSQIDWCRGYFSKGFLFLWFLCAPVTCSFHRSKTVLACINSDLLGPIDPATLGGKKYIMSFIENFTRYNFVYLLSAKHEAFSAFHHFQNWVESNTVKKYSSWRQTVVGSTLQHSS